MSKYEPLGEFLRARTTRETPMTFAEIEQVIGVPLPPKAQNYAAWWSNNPSNNTMTRIWLDAGYRTERVDLSGRRLVFVRTEKSSSDRATTGTPPAFGRVSAMPNVARHPLLGSMKGMIKPAPGVDFTEPANPDWGKAVHGDS